MSTERLSMRKLREVLRLSLDLGLGPRAISRSCELSPSTVSGYVGRAKVAKLVWPLSAELDDDTTLERRLFPDELAAAHLPPLRFGLRKASTSAGAIRTESPTRTCASSPLAQSL